MAKSPTPSTIFALSSGRPPAAIAVIRMSGPRAGDALRALTGKIPAPRQAALARIRDPQSGDIIDEALALWFPAPHSETGEDVAELQLHGGRAVIEATLAALSRIEGLKPAEAGEFTRRAFENGKLDLTAVEGLADLVAAETEGQRRQAFRQMKGLLGDRAETWRQRLIQALALVEARIDFSDEGDVPQDLLAPALAMARSLADEIAGALADGGRGERLREGLVVAIAGPPNAGKSTLLNRLAKREAAIVSPYAGTTRDVIEVHLDLAGWPVTLLDTAGIRDTDDPVELEGVRRARARAAAADLVLWVVDAGDSDGSAVIPGREPTGPARLGQADDRLRERDRNPGSQPGARGFRASPSGRSRNGDNVENGEKSPDLPALAPLTWLIRNKIDLIEKGSGKSEPEIPSIQKNEQGTIPNKALKDMVNNQLSHKNEHAISNNELVFNISATTGEGFDQLLGQLARQAEGFLAGSEAALVTRERHRHALEEVLAALRRALARDVAGREDLVAEELRIAARALGRLTGRVDVEDILDVIFRDFCIGK
jgi:tRNA modification GTPase